VVPKVVTLMTLNRVGLMAVIQRYFSELDTFRPIALKWSKLDPYCQGHDCRSGNPVFGDIDSECEF